MINLFDEVQEINGKLNQEFSHGALPLLIRMRNFNKYDFVHVFKPFRHAQHIIVLAIGAIGHTSSLFTYSVPFISEGSPS